LPSAVARVQREVNFIFKEAIAEWQALPPPNVQSNPPTLQGCGYEAVEVRGKLLNFDQNTIVRWISNNPGGTDDYFGVVHYGTAPKELSQIAKSHVRLNQDDSETSSACAWTV
jgi:hypothetical protein